MNSPVFKLLHKNGRYSESELLLLEEELQFRNLEKGEIFLDKGETCSSVCFISKGAMYQYKIDSEIEMRVVDLRVENEWVVNYQSFSSRKPSEYIIRAFEETSIYELSMDAIHSLIARSQSFFQLGNILEESTARMHILDNHNTPDEKYLYLLKNKPKLIQIFPQKLIASYLNVTPETLSRVRNRLVEV